MHVFDAEFFCHALSMFPMPAGDSDHTCTHAVTKSGNLRGAGKARSYDANPNWFCGTQTIALLRSKSPAYLLIQSRFRNRLLSSAVCGVCHEVITTETV